MKVVRPRFGDNVYHAAGSAAKFSVCSAGNDLEFLHRFESDINGRSLSPHLLAEKPVVEDAALSIEIDLITIRALRNSDARREGEEVFKLASEDGSLRDGGFIKSRGTLRLGDFNDRHIGDHDLLSDR